eukprot:1146305-Pelagomonas_calceolata.AAC.2
MATTATAPNQAGGGGPEAGEGAQARGNLLKLLHKARRAWVGRLRTPHMMDEGVSENDEPVQERRKNSRVC